MSKLKAILKSSQSSQIRNLTSGRLKNIIGPKHGQMQKSQFPYDLLTSPNYRQGIVCTAYQLENRTRDALYSDRNQILKSQSKVLDNVFKNKTNTNALCNIFLPPSRTAVDSHQLQYSEGKDGWLANLRSKGLGGVIGSSVFGVIDEVTGGIMQDQYGETVDKRTKLVFNDSEPRQMIYLNTFTFRNINDLIAFAEIYYLFTFLSYPQLDTNGGHIGDVIQEISNEYKKLLNGEVVNGFGSKGVGDKQILAKGIEQLKDFSVIKVPPVWKIQTFTKQQSNLSAGSFSVNAGSIIPQQTFGPAVITSIRFNKTPNQMFQSFRAFPNDPVQVEMEITFRELFPLRNSQIFDSVQ